MRISDWSSDVCSSDLSGAGKSTLLSLVAGFEAPLAGRVMIDGRDVTGWTPAERPVTSLFQEHNLFAHLNAAENVGLGLDPGLRLDAAQRRTVAEALGRSEEHTSEPQSLMRTSNAAL